MTIDEAIRHCEETAEAKEKIARAADSVPYTVIIDYEKIKACKECANDHRQLASWLGDLKTAVFLLGEAVNEIYKGTSCNPTAWLDRYGETASELCRRIEYDT